MTNRKASCLTLIVVLFAVPRIASAEPVARLRPWNEYRTIMWIGDTAYKKPEKLPLFFQRLRELGINTAMVYGEADPKTVFDNHFPYYVENMVNRGLCLKFSSSVTDWDKFVTDWARNGRPESALVRDYCLDDPKWIGSSSKTVQTIVRKNQLNRPLAYNIRDELSTTISANPFDYDFHPFALDHFRSWLKSQYGTLDALNREWETSFGSWAEVRPFTTDRIKNRMVTGEMVPQGQPDWQKVQQLKFAYGTAADHPTRWNFSPWADFRTYMDLSLARALDALRESAHALDPATPVGIEGTQMPAAFGGYDLWRLSQALDWVEPYDIRGAREIFGSFMPGRPILTTVFESETNPAQRRLWHLLLEGDRGCLVWWSEDCINWKSPDWQLTTKAKALRPVLQELTSPLARLFLLAERETDPIYIHYSQPSIQVDWLLESTVDGSTWLRRFSSFEAEHNQMAKTRVAWLKALQDLGYSPRFLSSEQLEAGKLPDVGNAVLVLANSWALSNGEFHELEAQFGTPAKTNSFRRVLLEGPAGVFDQHCKLRLEKSAGGFLPLAYDAEGCAAVGPGRIAERTPAQSRSYLADRLKPAEESNWFNWLKRQVAEMPPEILLPSTAHAHIHRFRTRSSRLLAFERNIDYQMSEELKQAGGNQSLEKPLEAEAQLRDAGHIYDLRTGTYLGFTKHIAFTLDPWHPSLFAVLTNRIPADKVVEQLTQELLR